MESGLPDYQAAIDNALQLVYSQHTDSSHKCILVHFVSCRLEDLRFGPLGRDLQRLAALARGEGERAERSRAFGD